ncbi:MAG: sensor histidine kinase [Lawsonibacter sp.]
MSDKPRGWKLPGAGWLSAKLSRKMIFALLGVALLGWGLSFSWFLSYLRGYVYQAYDQAIAKAQEQAQQVASFLEGSQGSCQGLEDYLAIRQLGCTVQDASGAILFSFTPSVWTDARLAVSGTATVSLTSGQSLRLRVWCSSLSREDLSNAVSHRAFQGLALFNLAILLVAGTLLYLLLVSPIMGLRRTMRDYWETGALPPRSPRMDEVGKLQNTFADLTGVLRAKEQSERRLIASISHDIKTPLTSVLGYSERLLHAKLTPEKQEQYLQGIHDKGLAIQSIVDEFDSYLEAGLRDKAPMELTTAQALCDNLRREYQGELLDANVSLNIRCLSPSARLFCNPAHMRRYFGNLISNSIQHSAAHQLQLEMLCRQEGKDLILEFSDNGMGVSEEEIPRIFEPLYTSDRGRKVSGLGLSICRSIIQAHGGTLSAYNRPQGGLCIRAVLPCVENQ